MSENININTVTQTKTWEAFTVNSIQVSPSTSTAYVYITLVDTSDGTSQATSYTFTGTDYSSFFDNTVLYDLIATELGTTIIT